MTSEDTLPKLVVRNYRKYGDTKVAMRKKVFGSWEEYTWEEYYLNVKYFSLGLVSLGLQPQDKVAIIGDNDPQWYWAELASQAAGGVVLGIYTDSSPNELKYIIDHSDSKFAVVKDQEQLDKMLQIKDELPNLEKVIYWDPKGLGGYQEPLLIGFEEMLEIGKEYEASHPDAFEHNVEKGKGEDLAILCYTSGTTALPKGAMLSYDNLMSGSAALLTNSPWRESDNYLSYISPAWLTEQALGISGGLMSSAIINFPEEPETMQQNMREIAPQYVMYTARLWESLCSTVQAKIADASSSKRFIYNLFLPVGHKVADTCFEKRKPGLLWKFLYTLGDLLLFRPLKDKLGLLKTKGAITGGAVLGPDVFRFFHAIGVPLRQVYALTEVPSLAEHQMGEIKFESVGPPTRNVELRISDDGEMLATSPALFCGYYKAPELTSEKIKDGRFHTGDAGHIDEDGHVIYWDRVSDLFTLSGGVKYSPVYIESRLKFSPYLKDAMVIGGENRPRVTVMINIDFENVGRWAEGKKIAYTTFADLSQKPEVYDLIRKDIEKVNKTLPSFAKIKRCVLLHKEFDPDEAELTRTRKLRRAFIEDRYRSLIDAMYEDKQEFAAETEVKYTDGRTGITRTSIKIMSLEEDTGQ